VVLRFQAQKPWIVRAPSATTTYKVRTRTNGTRSKHEWDTVEREAHGNKDSGSQWQGGADINGGSSAGI
ncbi:BgTH12-06236, partial [Blumeria graminis f. sp. triticale]